MLCAIRKLFFLESSCNETTLHPMPPSWLPLVGGKLSSSLDMLLAAPPCKVSALCLFPARSFALELCRARLSLLGTGVDLAMQSCLIQMFILFCLCCRDSQRAGRRCGHHEPPGPGPLLPRKEVDGRRDYRTASTEDGLDGSAAITGLLLLYPYF